MKKFLFLALFVLLAVPAAAEMVSVIHQPAELRAKPLVARSRILGSLARYTPLEVLGSESEYYKVKDFSGQTGYIHRSLVGKSDSLVITGSVCNVRSGPNTEQPIVFKATRGEGFRAISRHGEWIEIRNAKGNAGWVWQNLTWGY